MKFIDVQHPFFIPMYRRVLVVVFCLGWAVFEFVGGSGSPFWGILFGGMGLFCAHQFFIAFNPVLEPKPTDKDASE